MKDNERIARVSGGSFSDVGFGYYEKLLTSDEVNELRMDLAGVADAFERGLGLAATVCDEAEIDRRLVSIVLQRPDIQGALYDRMQQMPSLLRLPSNAKIQALARELLKSEHLGVWPRVQLRFDRKGDTANLIMWHHDYIYNGGTSSSVTFWIPLVDVTAQMGLLKIAPGSHLNGKFEFLKEGAGRKFSYTLPDDVVSNLTTMSPEVDAGDCVAFHSLTVHTGTPVLIDGRARLTALFRIQDLNQLDVFNRNAK